MHKRLLCSHLPRSLKKLEGSAVLIIFVYCGSEEKGRSKEKQEEEEEERQRPDARRKQKSKLEEASQSHRFYHLSTFIFGWVHALCAALNFLRPAFTCQGPEERR